MEAKLLITGIILLLIILGTKIAKHRKEAMRPYHLYFNPKNQVLEENLSDICGKDWFLITTNREPKLIEFIEFINERKYEMKTVKDAKVIYHMFANDLRE